MISPDPLLVEEQSPPVQEVVRLAKPSQLLLLIGVGLLQVRFFVDLHWLLQAEPAPQADQPPVMTQVGWLVVVVSSDAVQIAFSVFEPGQAAPPLAAAGLLQ